MKQMKQKKKEKKGARAHAPAPVRVESVSVDDGEIACRKASIEMFRCGVCVFIGTPAACVRRLRVEGIPQESIPCPEELDLADKGAQAICINLPAGDACIYSDHLLPKSVMVHELCHAVNHILKTRDCLDENGSELFSYCMEYLYRELVGEQS